MGMLYVNGSSAVVALGTLLLSGNAPTAITFCMVHPLFMTHAFALSVAAVGGQYFVYSQIGEFGALILAATMNLRQVISILVSYIMYSHPISSLQVLGLGLVFGALFYKSYASLAKSREGNSKATGKDVE